MRKIAADIDPFTIVKAYFAKAKFFFKSAMMEKLQSLSNHQNERRVDSKSSKGYKSLANEWVTPPIKNKEKDKIVENFVNKVSCKAIILWYILVSTRIYHSTMALHDMIYPGIKKRVILILPMMNRRSLRGLKTWPC